MLLSEASVAIVGLGLMGGSLGLALRGKCRARLGVARRDCIAQQALELGAVDHASTDFCSSVGQADIVVLAAPVCTIVEQIDHAGAVMKPGSLLLDLGSTKGQVVEAMDRLPEHLRAVGGHPMCGKEKGGLEHASTVLYADAPFALTPTVRTTGNAMALASELVEAIGGKPLVIDAARHDRAVAVISHLPYLLAGSLVRAEAEAEVHDPVVGKLASSGFRDTSRLAASEVVMMRDILLTNRQSIEEALDVFEKQLSEARRLLSDPEALESWMTATQLRRRRMFS